MPTEFKEITARSEYGSWVRLLLEEETGWVIILSDYGNWSYRWTHIGTRTLTEFLAKLDTGYMGGKMLGASINEYGHKETEEEIRQYIAEYYTPTTLEGQAEIDFLEELVAGELDFRGWVDQTVIPEAWDLSRTTVNSSWSNFWEYLWEPHVVPQLKSNNKENK